MKYINKPILYIGVASFIQSFYRSEIENKLKY